MRAMLNDASLPLEFWDEAVTTDIYLINRTNSGPIVDGKISSQKEYGQESPHQLITLECGEVSVILISILRPSLLVSAMTSL
jgi:hypothetical protein